MKKAFNIAILLSFMTTLIISCGNSSGKNNSTSENNSELMSTAITSENCLEKYHGKPEELLTAELVSQFVDFEGETPSVEKVSEQIIRDPDFAQVNCKWKIDRKRRIVRLKQISKIKLYKSKTPVDRFNDKYHTRTEKEKAELKEIYDKEVTEKVNNKDSEKVSTTIGMDFEYIKVDNIGDAAVWEHKVNDLKVLLGEYQFTVNVDLNQGNEYDLEKAKLIANAIIDKACN